MLPSLSFSCSEKGKSGRHLRTLYLCLVLCQWQASKGRRETRTSFAAWGWLVEMDVVGLLDIRLAYEQALAESGGRAARAYCESGKTLAAGTCREANWH